MLNLRRQTLQAPCFILIVILSADTSLKSITLQYCKCIWLVSITVGLWINRRWFLWTLTKKSDSTLNLINRKPHGSAKELLSLFRVITMIQLVLKIRDKMMMRMMMSASVQGIPLCADRTENLRKQGYDWLPQDSSWWRHWRWRQAALELDWIDSAFT